MKVKVNTVFNAIQWTGKNKASVVRIVKVSAWGWTWKVDYFTPAKKDRLVITKLGMNSRKQFILDIGDWFLMDNFNNVLVYENDVWQEKKDDNSRRCVSQVR